MGGIYFWVFAAVMVCVARGRAASAIPMYSVLLLLASFGALAGSTSCSNAPFVAAIQIIIYAGAIIVLFLFVVMLLNVPTEDPPHGYHARLLGGAGRAGSARCCGRAGRRAVCALSHLRSTPLPAAPNRASTSVGRSACALFASTRSRSKRRRC
jgi:NADH-quinone oxidoreductase subunit J